MKNFKLRTLLIGSFLMMALLVAFTGVFGALSTKRVGSQIQNILEQLSKQQKLVLLMGVAQKNCHVSLMQTALVRSEPASLLEYAEDYRVKRNLLRTQAQTILNGNEKLGVLPALKGASSRKGRDSFWSAGRSSRRSPSN